LIAAGGGSSPSSGSSSCCPKPVECFRAAGQKVEGDKVFLDPEFLLEQVAKAPREFDLQARNPEHSVKVGGNSMVFAPVYGPPFVREGDVRRDAKMADFENFVRLSQSFPSSTRPGAPSSSRRTGRSTRATSTWCTRCRRCPTSPTWAP
jgi:trimethylamine:corrinoid methyltransferase-like protein